jgi:hypothetical protein
MQPSMDVRFATEIRYHVRPFDLPDIPDFIITDILAFIER